MGLVPGDLYFLRNGTEAHKAPGTPMRGKIDACMVNKRTPLNLEHAGPTVLEYPPLFSIGVLLECTAVY